MTVAAQVPPTAWNEHERKRALAAADAAERRYPGPVGKLVARELRTWALMGWLGQGSHTAALVDDLLIEPAPPPVALKVHDVEPPRTRLGRIAARIRRHH